jgi:hypothetical protein
MGKADSEDRLTVGSSSPIEILDMVGRAEDMLVLKPRSELGFSRIPNGHFLPFLNFTNLV